jgi:hypothetical protein
MSELTDLLAGLSEEMKHIRHLEKPEDWPVTVSSVKLTGAHSPLGRDRHQVGSWVATRPVSDNPENKTYLGIYLGELPLYSGTTSCAIDDRNNAMLVSGFLSNPAMYVPDLKRIVWGCGSWWTEINSPEGLRQISDTDIENVWYVQALKHLAKEDK